MKKIFFLLGITAMAFCACDSNEEDDPTPSKHDRIATNKLIYDIMDTYYLWSDELPLYKKDDDRNPEAFFKSLLSSKDRWSYMSDNNEDLSSELEGTPYSMGYSPQFWLLNDGKNVFTVIEYVYPGSPADKAGLKRGDIILTINGQMATPDNYYKLYMEKEATIELGKLHEDNMIDVFGGPIKLSAEVVKADPSLYSKIIDINGTPVGYYVYTQYASGPDNCYYSSMDAIFDGFVAAGVKDLILDLRYNSGGGTDVAQHLSSSIAPASVVENKSVFTSYVYNDLLTKEYAKYNDESVFTVRYSNNNHNADIKNLYVLTTSNTASASELTIIGLMPYMNVTLIGESTYGKYTGMYMIDKTAGEGFADLNNWALMPIVLKFANADGFTDFENGISPDYEVKDNVIGAYPFGDENDPALATALSLIGNQPLTAKAAKADLPFTFIGRDKGATKNNSIIRMGRQIQ